MTRKEVINILNDLEDKYPVDQWTICDIQVWPLIKTNLFFTWSNTHHPKESLIEKKIKSTSIVNKVSKRVRSFVKLGKLMLFQPKREVPILFSGANTHRVDFNGAFINRYFQPIIEYLDDELHQETVMIEYLPKDVTKNYNPQKNLFFIDEYKYATRIIIKIIGGAAKLRLSKFAEFIKDVNKQLHLDLHEKEYLNSILNLSKEIKANALLYSIFLRKYKPKFVMGLCYYNEPMYGLDYAAKKLGITSIDMQHGGQGYLHPAYGFFKKVPEKGYNILPKTFWCWNQTSASDLNSWIKEQTFHKVLVGGNPWIDYAIVKGMNYKFPDKKIILYTLQFSQLDDYILRTIKNTPPDYQWWLRLHPRKVHESASIRAQLQQNSLDRLVNIDEATNWPLPIILSKSHIHISMYSGSIIEAAQLGVPCIIIHEIGVQTYKEFLSEGKAIECIEKDEKRLLSIIDSLAFNQKKNIFSDPELYKIINDMLILSNENVG